MAFAIRWRPSGVIPPFRTGFAEAGAEASPLFFAAQRAF